MWNIWQAILKSIWDVGIIGKTAVATATILPRYIREQVGKIKTFFVGAIVIILIIVLWRKYKK